MSKNLFKTGFDIINNDDARMIDNNGLSDSMIEEEYQRAAEERRAAASGDPDGNLDDQDGNSGEDGFSGGLTAETVENADDSSNVIKAESTQCLENAKAEAEQILSDARAQAEDIVDKARQSAENEKQEIYDDARRQASDDDAKDLEAEEQKRSEEYKEKQNELERRYQDRFDELEPQLVDTISQVYEHVFRVDISKYHDIVTQLIITTMRSTERCRSYIIHVSHDDYPSVSMEKSQLQSTAGGEDCKVDVIEDISLTKGQCLIENENGILDCGIDTELTELRRRLKILSFRKENADDRNS